MKIRKTYLLFLGLCLFASGHALASEGMWEENGVFLGNATNPSWPQLISYDSGGALIAWRSSTGISAQRIDSAGSTKWGANGVVICDAGGQCPQIIPADSGGAIIVWYDYRFSNSDIYAQRIDGSGVVQWTANGVVICNAGDNQIMPQLVSDGSGGAIIVWQDSRSGDYDIYAQRVDSDGNTKWADNGVVICNAGGLWPQIIPADSGGALIVWRGNGVYVQRIDSSGNTQWTANGVVISNHPGLYPQLISHGSGDALIVWQDSRSGDYDIYAQRIDSVGSAQWTANGVVISNAENNQRNPQLASDGSGGAMIVWESEQAGGYYDIYSQRIAGNGTVQWPANGVSICNAENNQYNPQLVPDNSGGAIIVWADRRNSAPTDWDIYAQRIDSEGAVQWTANGVIICNAENIQYCPQFTFDGNGEIIIWNDCRVSSWAIYAQKIIRPKPQITGLIPSQSPWGKTANITIQGCFFHDDRGFATYAKLTRTPDAYIEDLNPNVINANTLSCNFDLNSPASQGDWYVVVYDSLGQTGTSDTILFNVHQPVMQSLAWISAQTANIYTGTRDNLVGQINCTADGYDFLESLSVENVGNALAGTDINTLSLWYQSNGGSGGITFDPLQAQKLGDFTAISGERTWHITLDKEVNDRSALYITANVNGSAQVGNTCRFSLPVNGAGFRFKGALPAFTLLNAIKQMIARSVNLRLEVISSASANVTQGQTGVLLGRIELTNITGGAILLDTILLSLQDKAGNGQDLDTVFARIWLEHAGITVSNLSAPFSNKVFTLAPSLNLSAQDQADFELKGDIKSLPSLKSFVIGLPHGQCINSGELLSEPVSGKTFPLLTNQVNIREPELAKVFSNYPNPFQPGQGVTRIPYYMKNSGRVKIKVMTISRVCVKVLLEEDRASGMYEAEWDGKNAQGHEVKSGVYLLRIKAKYSNGSVEQMVRKVAVIR